MQVRGPRGSLGRSWGRGGVARPAAPGSRCPERREPHSAGASAGGLSVAPPSQVWARQLPRRTKLRAPATAALEIRVERMELPGPFPQSPRLPTARERGRGGRTRSRGTVIGAGKWAFPGLWVSVGCISVGGLPGHRQTRARVIEWSDGSGLLTPAIPE